MNDLIEVLDSSEVSEIIKPMIKEIFLFDSFIAGTSYIKNQEIFKYLKEQDSLLFIREDNPFDEKAICIYNSSKEKLGYVPRKDNVIFARLMDAGKILKGKVQSIQKIHNYYEIKIGIYLLDI